MLKEFGGKLVECEEEILLPWGPRILLQLEEADEEKQKRNRAQLLAVCAKIQQRPRRDKPGAAK